jgi:hypothetical protein
VSDAEQVETTPVFVELTQYLLGRGRVKYDPSVHPNPHSLRILKHPCPNEVLHMRKGLELLLENNMIPHDPNAPHGEPPEESPQKTDRLKAARNRAGKNGLRPVGGGAIVDQ